MGWARILDGGPNGRYTIELDWGESTRTAVLAALGVRVAELDAKLVIAEAKVIDADAQEAPLRAEVTAQMEAYIATSAALPPASPRPDSSGFKSAMLLLQRVRQKNAGLRLSVDKLKFERAVALERVSYWTNFSPIETRPAWCASLKEDKAPGSVVATLDIKGESDLIVIAPDARAWQPSDGVLTAREMMSPEQAFWNAAVLPGWQKFDPTYRWGTVTSINYAADTMDVTLGSALSSAQRLDVNQASALAAVPVIYGTCHSKAFKVADRVVVQFVNQNWAAPLVIGFLDNPRGCGWACVGAAQEGASGVAIYFATTDQEQIDTLLASTASNWFARTSNGPDGFNPIGDTWPGHSATLPDTSPGVSFDYINDVASFAKGHAKNIAPGTEDSVGLSGLAFRPGYLPLALPPEYVGVLLFRCSGYRFDAPSFIGDLPDEWAELLVTVGSKVILNVAARVANHPGMPITVDIAGGILPIITELPVGRFPHTLYVENLP